MMLDSFALSAAPSFNMVCEGQGRFETMLKGNQPVYHGFPVGIIVWADPQRLCDTIYSTGDYYVGNYVCNNEPHIFRLSSAPDRFSPFHFGSGCSITDAFTNGILEDVEESYIVTLYAPSAGRIMINDYSWSIIEPGRPPIDGSLLENGACALDWLVQNNSFVKKGDPLVKMTPQVNHGEISRINQEASARKRKNDEECRKLMGELNEKIRELRAEIAILDQEVEDKRRNIEDADKIKSELISLEHQKAELEVEITKKRNATNDQAELAASALIDDAEAKRIEILRKTRELEAETQNVLEAAQAELESAMAESENMRAVMRAERDEISANTREQIAAESVEALSARLEAIFQSNTLATLGEVPKLRELHLRLSEFLSASQGFPATKIKGQSATFNALDEMSAVYEYLALKISEIDPDGRWPEDVREKAIRNLSDAVETQAADLIERKQSND